MLRRAGEGFHLMAREVGDGDTALCYPYDFIQSGALTAPSASNNSSTKRAVARGGSRELPDDRKGFPAQAG